MAGEKRNCLLLNAKYEGANSEYMAYSNIATSATLTKQRFVSKVFILKIRKGGLFSFGALRNQVSRIEGADSLIIGVGEDDHFL